MGLSEVMLTRQLAWGIAQEYGSLLVLQLMVVVARASLLPRGRRGHLYLGLLDGYTLCFLLGLAQQWHCDCSSRTRFI